MRYVLPLLSLLAFWFILVWSLRSIADALERNGRSRWLVVMPGLAILVLLADRLSGRSQRPPL